MKVRTTRLLRLTDKAPVRFARDLAAMAPAGPGQGLRESATKDPLKPSKATLDPIERHRQIRGESDRPDREKVLFITPKPAKRLNHPSTMPSKATKARGIRPVKRRCVGSNTIDKPSAVYDRAKSRRNQQTLSDCLTYACSRPSPLPPAPWHQREPQGREHPHRIKGRGRTFPIERNQGGANLSKVRLNIRARQDDLDDGAESVRGLYCTSLPQTPNQSCATSKRNALR